MAGEMDKSKGRLKRAWGEITGNQSLKNEGTIDKMIGILRSTMDHVIKIIQGK